MNNLSLLTFLQERLACLHSQQIRKIGYLKFLVAALLLSSGDEQANAQGVGINTTTPHPSAALDIQSTNKGLLIPQVALQSLSDNTTVPSPATGLLVYNKNNILSGPGFYQNIGTTATPYWEILSRLKLPYSQGVSTTTAFNIQNFQGSSGTIAIKGYSSGVGTGIFAESDNGFALQVKGFMKIFGGGQSPSQGKVLTSNALGEATWQGGVAFSAVGIKGNGGEVVAKQVVYKVPFATELYDLNNNYSDFNQSPASSFVAPVDGIYHFDVSVSFNVTSFDFEEGTILTELSLQKVSNGATSLIALNDKFTIGQNNSQISIDTKLVTGDQVFVTFRHFKFDHLNLATNPAKSYFNGRLVINQ